MPINMLWDSEGRLTIAVYKVLGQSFGSYGCGVYKVVFDQCPFYLIFNPVFEHPLMCKLVIGDEHYSLCHAIFPDFAVDEEYRWQQGVIGSREDRAVIYLSSGHSSADCL